MPPRALSFFLISEAREARVMTGIITRAGSSAALDFDQPSALLSPRANGSGLRWRQCSLNRQMTSPLLRMNSFFAARTASGAAGGPPLRPAAGAAASDLE